MTHVDRATIRAVFGNAQAWWDDDPLRLGAAGAYWRTAE